MASKPKHTTDQHFEDWYATLIAPVTVPTNSYPTMTDPHPVPTITIGNRTYNADDLGRLLDHLFELYPEALV